MNDYYLPIYFSANELVDPTLHAMLREDEILKLFDPDILRFADWCRERYGHCTINDWAWGGKFSWSGYRTPASPWYSQGSMHSIGGALDMKFADYTAEEIRDDLREYEKLHGYVPYITRIEDGVGWLHGDTKPTANNRLYFFNP